MAGKGGRSIKLFLKRFKKFAIPLILLLIVVGFVGKKWRHRKRSQPRPQYVPSHVQKQTTFDQQSSSKSTNSVPTSKVKQRAAKDPNFAIGMNSLKIREKEIKVCSDVVGFTDENGNSCMDWNGYDCYLSNEESFSQHGRSELLRNCPKACGICDNKPTTVVLDNCFDSLTFTDELGYNCEEWKTENCFQAIELGLSPEGQEHLLHNCRKACGLCGGSTIHKSEMDFAQKDIELEENKKLSSRLKEADLLNRELLELLENATNQIVSLKSENSMLKATHMNIGHPRANVSDKLAQLLMKNALLINDDDLSEIEAEEDMEESQVNNKEKPQGKHLNQKLNSSYDSPNEMKHYQQKQMHTDIINNTRLKAEARKKLASKAEHIHRIESQKKNINDKVRDQDKVGIKHHRKKSSKGENNKPKVSEKLHKSPDNKDHNLKSVLTEETKEEIHEDANLLGVNQTKYDNEPSQGRDVDENDLVQDGEEDVPDIEEHSKNDIGGDGANETVEYSKKVEPANILEEVSENDEQVQDIEGENKIDEQEHDVEGDSPNERVHDIERESENDEQAHDIEGDSKNNERIEGDEQEHDIDGDSENGDTKNDKGESENDEQAHDIEGGHEAAHKGENAKVEEAIHAEKLVNNLEEIDAEADSEDAKNIDEMDDQAPIDGHVLQNDKEQIPKGKVKKSEKQLNSQAKLKAGGESKAKENDVSIHTAKDETNRKGVKDRVAVSKKSQSQGDQKQPLANVIQLPRESSTDDEKLEFITKYVADSGRKGRVLLKSSLYCFMHTNTDIEGNSIRRIPDIFSLNKCMAECEMSKLCTHFTYRPPAKLKGKKAECELKQGLELHSKESDEQIYGALCLRFLSSVMAVKAYRSTNHIH
eukprot:m.37331 g.37331  ORF g.37331 m.37331 type:complete len:876 (-) comp9299_c0_seq1:81-2708(-)